MTHGLLILIAAFVVAVLGFFASNLALPGDKGLFGLSRLGTAMLAFSLIGLMAGVWKEISESRDGEMAKKRSQVLQKKLEDNSHDLKLIRARLDGLADQQGISAEVTKDIRLLADEVSAIASAARDADFRKSDFTRSHFGLGNFTMANFEKALFESVWLKGALISNSNLEDVDFKGSSFSGAKFGAANLNGADLRGADLSKVIFDSKTKLPK